MISRSVWPVVLEHGDVRLRPLRRRDGPSWHGLRARNALWLRPWEPTVPEPGASARGYGHMLRALRREASAGRAMPFAIDYRGRLVGQLTASGIAWGSLRSAAVGYWVDQEHAGRGIMPVAVALAVDHCLLTAGLHRIEVNIRPENTASLRVVEKLGFRDEGLRRDYLHIDGAWRDHRTFALTLEDVPSGLLRELVRGTPGFGPSPRF
ncbi:MAG: GNAT family N-acetyltransferase [Actinomycetes bacterium]